VEIMAASEEDKEKLGRVRPRSEQPRSFSLSSSGRAGPSHAHGSRGPSDGLPGRSAGDRTARGRAGSTGPHGGAPTARACRHVAPSTDISTRMEYTLPCQWLSVQILELFCKFQKRINYDTFNKFSLVLEFSNETKANHFCFLHSKKNQFCFLHLPRRS
jgi:hypothetical protein